MDKTDVVDEDGRLWTYDQKAHVWYAPDWGLEFSTREEIEENYGPLAPAEGS